MDIDDTYRANIWNLQSLAQYLDTDRQMLETFYADLRADDDFLADVNDRVKFVKQTYGFHKGIFGMDGIPSVDWFAFERILLYVVTRFLKPEYVLETGVYYGGNSLFLLKGLADNGSGHLVSIDYPDSSIRQDTTSLSRHPEVGDTEYYRDDLLPGFIVPEALNNSWNLIIGDSLKEIPKRPETFDLYVHDSDHAMPFLQSELSLAHERLADDATVIVHDIDWSNGFFEYCVNRKLSPVLFTDNGKDNLRVRLGMAQLSHPNNKVASFTG